MREPKDIYDRVYSVVRFSLKTPTNYTSGERAWPTDDEYGKKFEKNMFLMPFYRVCKVVCFCRETPTNYISGESARPTDHEYRKIFENFGNFRGSEISVISGYGFFSQAHENQTNCISSESASDADQ